jgi:hypothetical protein
MKKIEIELILMIESEWILNESWMIFEIEIELKKTYTSKIVFVQYLHKVWRHGECFRASNTAAYGQSISLFYAITHVWVIAKQI